MEKEKSIPELIMLCGIPASGKSTETEKLHKQGYEILSSDKLRLEFAGTLDVFNLPEEEQRKINSEVFEYVKTQAHALLKKGVSVVIDATNLGRKKRRLFLKNFRDIPCVKKCMLFITPFRVCIERNNARVYPAKVPYNAMNKMIRNFEVPCYEEGFAEIVPIVYPEPYSFPFEKTVDFSQDNPHHTLTLHGHLEKAKAYAIENGQKDYLIKLAYYHDIGKLYTKRFKNSKGEACETAHYYGHENCSAYLYLAESCCGKTLTKQEFDQILYETLIINCHMFPLNRWKEFNNAKRKDTDFYGEKLINDVLELNKADRYAH